jgi:phage/plasmid-like protein (TIGR03299 family)
MPANISKMFYYGQIPLLGKGTKVKEPLTVAEAIKEAGLDWQVEEIDLRTYEEPTSPVRKRKALVRADIPAGHPHRVLGVVHKAFSPVQNREAAAIFDSLFGHGKAVYHTGGYLGAGEVIWLLAKLDRRLSIGGRDFIEPYALMVNSHDGSRAFTLSLTTIRVVCSNMLNVALDQCNMPKFRQAHRGNVQMHREAAKAYWRYVLAELDGLERDFQKLAQCACTDAQYRDVLNQIFPLPRRPLNPSPQQERAYAKRLLKVEGIRTKITELRNAGVGAELPSAQGTLWGVLNAVTEYIDHHHECSDRLAYSLLGTGSALKARAYKLVRELASSAA